MVCVYSSNTLLVHAYYVLVSQASRIFPRVRMRAVISGRKKGRKNTSGHSRQVFWSPTQNRVDQSGASYHVITRIFHVITYAVGNRIERSANVTNAGMPYSKKRIVQAILDAMVMLGYSHLRERQSRCGTFYRGK